MVKSKVSEWDKVAANNTDIGGITLDGAVMSPSLVDNAERESMAQIATQLGDVGAKGADIASAATTNLANATGWYLDITGTTTITSFGTVDEGQQYTLRFVSALTLTHNATSLILPGAANITTVANDIAVMMSLGSGNWRCIDYQRASGLPGDVTLTGTQTLSNKTLGSGTAFGAVPTGLDASLTAKGIIEQATDAEAIARADTARALSPSNLAAVTTASAISGMILSPTDKSYKLVVKCPFAGTVNETVTISASGTCTATFKINTTALGGTANSVSSSEQTQAHASANVFAAGDDIVVTISSNSSCADMSFTIKYTRVI